MAIPATINPTQMVRVSTCHSLPADAADWQLQPMMRCTAWSDGAGRLVGAATIMAHYGHLRLPGLPALGYFAIPGPNGTSGQLSDLFQYCVQLSLEDTPGDPQSTYTPFWWGVLSAATRTSDASSEFGGGEVTWTATSIITTLGTNYPNIGPEISGQNMAYIPPVNATLGGDRSANVDSDGFYRWDFTTPDGGSPAPTWWRAIDFLSMLLATPPGVIVGGAPAYLPFFNYAIADPSGALNFVMETANFNGISYLDILNSIINTKRGLTYNVTVAGNVITINVTSIFPTSLSIGSDTLPAATNPIQVDLSGDLSAGSIRMAASNASQYDLVEIQGDYPWVGGTLIINGSSGSLVAGWTAGEAAGWAAADPMLPPAPAWRFAYRRFLLAGGTVQSAFISNAQSIPSLSSGLQKAGVNIRSGTGNQPQLSLFNLRLENDLPGKIIPQPGPGLAPGWGSDPWAPHGKPIIVVKNPGGTYEDKSSTWSVSVISDPPGIMIDDHAAFPGNEIAYLIANGGVIYITLGARDLAPMAASYLNGGSFSPPNLRTKIIKVPNLQYWIMTDKSVSGTDGTNLLLQAGDLVVRDDTARLNALLALALVWYTVPAWAVSWSDIGFMDIGNSFRPGALITSFMDSAGQAPQTVNATITSRSCSLRTENGCETWQMHYESTRIIGDVEAVTTGADVAYKGT